MSESLSSVDVNNIGDLKSNIEDQTQKVQNPDLATHGQKPVEYSGAMRDLVDLETAVMKNQAAVDATPEGDPHKAERLLALASSFRQRYLKFRALQDLEAAMQNGQKAVDLTPKGHPDKTTRSQGSPGCLASQTRNCGPHSNGASP
ncbi:hypothetical protein C8R44DRAFT_778168 [Mycena epipterygia]|nr:hypothetical protein C8R44DRAFT_778168 [Mycena epipterygia]